LATISALLNIIKYKTEISYSYLRFVVELNIEIALPLK